MTPTPSLKERILEMEMPEKACILISQTEVLAAIDDVAGEIEKMKFPVYAPCDMAFNVALVKVSRLLVGKTVTSDKLMGKTTDTPIGGRVEFSPSVTSPKIEGGDKKCLGCYTEYNIFKHKKCPCCGSTCSKDVVGEKEMKA